MPARLACRACGVVMPERVGRCPSCGVRLWHLGALARAGLAVAVLVALGFAIVGIVRRTRIDPDLAADVQAYTGVRRLAPDGKGIEVSGHIENKSTVPVDVVVRFRGRDITGRAVSEIVSKRYRNLLPESSTPVEFKVGATPLDDVEIDIVELSRSPK